MLLILHCNRLLVGKKNELTSAMMQPADHTSEGNDHPTSKITSGPRYCRVFTTVDFLGSFSYVAPPKSITTPSVQDIRSE